MAVKAMGTQGESEARAEEIEIATARRDGTENSWLLGKQHRGGFDSVLL